jgi:parallel beta-helix repeat protein
VYCDRSGAVFSRCSIVKNQNGGVRCRLNPGTTFSECTVSQNYSDGRGGGFFIEDSTTTRIIDCTVSSNYVGLHTSGEGAGIYVEDSIIDISNCTVSGNAALNGQGGGVYLERCGGTVANCIFAGNWGEQGSGGGSFWGEDDPLTISNCLFVGNAGEKSAGGITLRDNTTFINCTVSGNSAERGGGITCDSGSPAIVNCIVWGNAGAPQIFTSHSGDPSVRFSCIEHEDLWPGEGNINENPLFKVPGTFNFNRFIPPQLDLPDFIVHRGDYHLKTGSPAIDAGTSEGAPPAGMEGNPRPGGLAVDMGIYESITHFIRGDVNTDGRVDLADPIYTISSLFRNGPGFPCMKAADVNDSGKVDLVDAICLLDYVFNDGQQPPPPFLECGTDPTMDDLDCESFAPCHH